jgi:hypothetical protein
LFRRAYPDIESFDAATDNLTAKLRQWTPAPFWRASEYGQVYTIQRLTRPTVVARPWGGHYVRMPIENNVAVPGTNSFI